MVLEYIKEWAVAGGISLGAAPNALRIHLLISYVDFSLNKSKYMIIENHITGLGRADNRGGYSIEWSGDNPLSTRTEKGLKFRKIKVN